MASQRSRSYQAIGLEEACDLVRGRLRKLAGRELDRDALGEELGYKSGSGGAAARKIAALTRYGLLDRRDGSYALSVLGRKIQRLPVRSTEFARAVRAAFREPPLFRELLAACEEDGEVPSDLPRLLENEYGITPRASSEAAEVFIRSAQFAELLAPDGRTTTPPEVDPAASNLDSRRLTESSTAQVSGSDFELPPVADRAGTRLQHKTFRLDLPKNEAGFMLLAVPKPITETNVQLLRETIDHYLDRLEKFFVVESAEKSAEVVEEEVAGIADSQGSERVVYMNHRNSRGTG